jgi:hypothetical protein
MKIAITTSMMAMIVLTASVFAAGTSTQPAAESDDVQSLTDEVERLRAKAASAQQALDSARAAAIRRLSQTREYQDAEAALANAQNEVDAADSPDARMQAATDKLDAKTRLSNLQDKAFASDQITIDAARYAADTSTQLKLAESRVEKAQEDQAAAAASAASNPLDEETTRELSQLSADNDRLRALATNASSKPSAATEGGESVGCTVSGAAWTAKNDGTSDIMRGLPVMVVERETTNVLELVDVLKKQKAGWQGWADDYKKSEEEDRKEAKDGAEDGSLSDGGKTMLTMADNAAADAAGASAKALEIQMLIDKLATTSSIDRLLALEMERHALELEKPESDGLITLNVGALPEVITDGGPSGIVFGSDKTDVDGKFVIDKVPPGDYYLISCFGSGTLLIDWIVPIHVEDHKATTVDLDNDNAAFIKQSSE